MIERTIAGVTAAYTDAEDARFKQTVELARRSEPEQARCLYDELAFIHSLKATLDATPIEDGDRRVHVSSPPSTGGGDYLHNRPSEVKEAQLRIA